MLSRTLWALTIACAMLAAGFYGWHLANHAMFARYVRSVDGGRSFEQPDRFEYYVGFAARSLRNPTREQIKPWWVRTYYDINPLHPGAGDVIRWGSDYRGPCGSHSYVVIALLQAHQIEARPLFITDDAGKAIHTVVEAHIGGRWVVGDPSYGVTFRRRDGQLATKEDLVADTSYFRSQVRGIPGYDPQYDYDAWTLLNWDKVPLVLPAVHLAVERLVGAERVKQIARPTIWMKPRRFYTGFFGLLALVGGTTAQLVSRRGKKSAAA